MHVDDSSAVKSGKGDLPPDLTRANFTRVLWERFKDPSMPNHATTLRYGEMLARAMSWDEPDPHHGKTEIVVKIGECQACKDAGRETQKDKRERLERERQERESFPVN